MGRPNDLDRIFELGVTRLRFGLLWERLEVDHSWKWADERLHQMQQLGLTAIAGLLHHGSGPPHTSLIDPAFRQKLAAHARCVSERYPWIDCYTPVNEPHTTARFSGMYGIWYPHHMDRLSYLRSLLLQVKATVLCMEAIQRVRPDAKLVQTDDVGSIRATSALRDLSDLMNERRWLAFDLLCATVSRDHPMFEYLLCSGIPARDILWFADHPCPRTSWESTTTQPVTASLTIAHGYIPKIAGPRKENLLIWKPCASSHSHSAVSGKFY